MSKDIISVITRAMNFNEDTMGAHTAQDILDSLTAAGFVVVPVDWLDTVMPRISREGGGPLNRPLLNEDEHCCEWTLYKERERVHAEFAKLSAAALAGRP